jgi:ATP-binding cassette subfamily B protein
VNEGSITVDGVDIRNIQLESLRKHIGIVQQDVFLFSGTIRENIAYGDLNATEAGIWEAARRASLEEFIVKLPEQRFKNHYSSITRNLISNSIVSNIK